MSDDQPRLGKYEILRTLGRGAMGVVYEGIDRVIERRVAIKTVRTEDIDADQAEEHLRRFLIEARAAGKLNHPHIVSLYDHGEQDGTAYLVMELVVGRELQQWFDDGHRYPVGETVRLMGELLGALGYSHRQGVIHRDVKPANIFITESGSLKLGDFGIARIESTQKTRVGLALGTPTHMAPEQIRGETADARSDLYAAGVILFQLLTGTRPFGGTMLTMALKVLNQPAPLVSSINPQVTAALDAVVTKALAKAADSRFQNAEEFWLALQQAAQEEFESTSPALPAAVTVVANSRSSSDTRSGMYPAGPAPAMAIPAKPEAVATTSAAPAATASASNHNRMPAWLIAGGSLAALIAAAWWWRIGQPAPPAPVGPAPALPRVPSPPPSAQASPDARALAAPPTAVPAEAGVPPADPHSRPVADRAATALPALTTPAMPEVSPAPPAPPPVIARRAPAAPPTTPPPPPASRREAQTASVREMAPAPPAPAQATAVPPPAARAPLPIRCSDILMKASLEALTTEESRYLRKECQ